MTLIDSEYQKQLNRMHAKGKFNNGYKAYRIVDKFFKDYQPTSVMDFGCGKGALIASVKELHPGIVSEGYDPGNPEFARLPDITFEVTVKLPSVPTEVMFVCDAVVNVPEMLVNTPLVAPMLPLLALMH